MIEPFKTPENSQPCLTTSNKDAQLIRCLQELAIPAFTRNQDHEDTLAGCQLDQGRVLFLSTNSQAAEIGRLIEGLKRLPTTTLNDLATKIVPFWNLNPSFAVTPEMARALYFGPDGNPLSGPKFVLATGEMRVRSEHYSSTVSSHPVLALLDSLGVTQFNLDKTLLTEISAKINEVLVDEELERLEGSLVENITYKDLLGRYRGQQTAEQSARWGALKLKRHQALDSEPTLVGVDDLGGFVQDLFSFFRGQLIISRAQSSLVSKDGTSSATLLSRLDTYSSLVPTEQLRQLEQCRNGTQKYLDSVSGELPYPVHSEKFLTQQWLSYNAEVQRAVRSSGVSQKEFIRIGSPILGEPGISGDIYREGTPEHEAYSQLCRMALPVYQALRQQGYSHSDICEHHQS